MADTDDISKPSIPLTFPVFGELKPGSGLQIFGKPKLTNGKGQFQIAFRKWSNANKNDLLLQISINFNINNKTEMILNSLKHNTWGKAAHHPNPFQLDDSFKLKIKIHDQHFKIKINGQEFEYGHKEQPDHIETVSIDGDLKVDRIRLKHFPKNTPKNSTDDFSGAHMQSIRLNSGTHKSAMYSNPTVPFEVKLPSRMRTPKYQIVGTPNSDAKQFTIQGINGKGTNAVTLNVYMQEQNLGRICNNEKEKTETPKNFVFPFSTGKTFVITLVEETYSYELLINDKKVEKLGCRDAFAKLNISGDLSLQIVNVYHNT